MKQKGDVALTSNTAYGAGFIKGRRSTNRSWSSSAISTFYKQFSFTSPAKHHVNYSTHLTFTRITTDFTLSGHAIITREMNRKQNHFMVLSSVINNNKNNK